MTEHTNIQKYVIIVTNSVGHMWVVGTDTQRGFTKAGATVALAKIEEALPGGWDAWITEARPINEILALRR